MPTSITCKFFDSYSFIGELTIEICLNGLEYQSIFPLLQSIIFNYGVQQKVEKSD